MAIYSDLYSKLFEGKETFMSSEFSKQGGPLISASSVPNWGKRRTEWWWWWWWRYVGGE